MVENMNLHYKNRYIKFIKNIQNQQNRILPEYTETHHIKPRCRNGTNDKDNLIELTLREHFLAHWLLWKAYPNFLPLASAFLQMCNKNPKLNKSFQGRITNRVYEMLKIEVYSQLSKVRKGFVYVRDENNNLLKLTKEEYKESSYKFHTTGKTYVYDTHENCWVYISSEEYQTNKDRYKTRLNAHEYSIDIASVKYNFVDNETQEIVKLTKPEVALKNKECGYKKYTQKINHKLVCIDDNNKKYTVSVEEYYTGDHKFHIKEKFPVYDTVNHDTVLISKEEYNLNPTRYLTSTKGKILAKDKDKNTILITKDEFETGQYVGHTKGLTTVFNKENNKYEQISTETFKNNPHKYRGPCYNKVNVINKITGERKQIPKNEFDKSIYVSLGNRSLLFLCVHKLTNQQKLINIYEWDLVKDNYDIIEIDKFIKAQMKK